MSSKPQRDPIKAHQRQAVAARRIGSDAKCVCGEARPEALIPGSQPIICAACERKSMERKIMDCHHFAGKTNNPLTVPVPVNDHRAVLSVDQYDWPKGTLENSEGSPLLAAAGCLRGFVDWILYLLNKGVLWIAEMLESLDALLTNQLGARWWTGTPLERFAPKDKS